MQKSFLTTADTDQRTNNDKAFEGHANQSQKVVQKRDAETRLKTKKDAKAVEYSMFEDVKPMSAGGQVSMF